MTHEEKCTSSERSWINASDGTSGSTPDEDAAKMAKQIFDTQREWERMTSEQAAKLAYGLQSYGRVEVVLSRSELNKLFAGDVGVIYCEYDQRAEELRICVEGSGLWRNWKEGQRPFNVRGKLLDSAYVMMEKDDHPRYLEIGPMDDMGQAERACINCGKTAHRPRQRCETLNSDKDGGRVCMNCGWNSDE